MSDRISLQDIFDKAWQAFIVEGKPPANENGIQCDYLTSDGRKCAVGLALPDGHPAQKHDDFFATLAFEFEELFDEDINKIIDHDAKYSIVDENHTLNRFQARLHDDWVSEGNWNVSRDDLKQEYIEVAKDYNLTVPETEHTVGV